LLTMVRQRVYGILADYEDQNDHDTLRSDRRDRRSFRGCLHPYRSWSACRTAASCSLLNDCHPQYVNAYRSGWRHTDRRNPLDGQELRRHLVDPQPSLRCQPLSQSHSTIPRLLTSAG
jgi:hypothetical protein